MNKIYVCFLISFLMGILFIGVPVYAASKFHMKEIDSFSIFSIRITDKIAVWVDEETGVEYLAVFDDKSLNALTPRYNSDGTLMIYKGK